MHRETPTIDATRSGPRTGFAGDIGTTRAVAAVVWAIAYLLALHGQKVAGGSDIPLLVGLLLAAYPVIDVVASLAERRDDTGDVGLQANLVVDALAIAGLLIAVLALHAEAVLIAFGAWALVSGLLQLLRARRAGDSQRARVPLMLSGGISAIAGLSFVASASNDVAQLAPLAGYAVLGAVFFAVSTLIARRSVR